jgi:hypothetical protein
MLLSLVGVSGMVKEAPPFEFRGCWLVLKGSYMEVSMLKLAEPAHLLVQKSGKCLPVGISGDGGPKADSGNSLFPAYQGAHAIHQIAVPEVRDVVGSDSILGLVSNMSGAHGQLSADGGLQKRGLER